MTPLPDSLSDYPWLQSAWQRLAEQQRQKRLPHGLLIHGPHGTAVEDLAETLAGSLMCECNQAGEGACGQCPSCQMLAAGSSADRLRVHCAEDKREIPVDAIRQLSEKLTLGRQRSAWRVVTVYPAERLSRAAANAFLKTLEEPAPDNLLILVCHDVARLLPTLRSRVQSHALALPSFEQAILWLKDKQPHSAEGHLALALLASQGAPLQALALLQNDGVSEFAQVRDDLLRLMQGRVSPSQLGQAWGEDLLQRLAWSATWCHVWLRQALGENRLPASVSGQGGPLPALPQTWWQQRYEDAVALRRLAQTPTNPQLLAEKYLLAWHAVARA